MQVILSSKNSRYIRTSLKSPYEAMNFTRSIGEILFRELELKTDESSVWLAMQIEEANQWICFRELFVRNLTIYKLMGKSSTYLKETN